MMTLLNPSKVHTDRDHATESVEIKRGLCAEYRSEHEPCSPNGKTKLAGERRFGVEKYPETRGNFVTVVAI